MRIDSLVFILSDWNRSVYLLKLSEILSTAVSLCLFEASVEPTFSCFTGAGPTGCLILIDVSFESSGKLLHKIRDGLAVDGEKYADKLSLRDIVERLIQIWALIHSEFVTVDDASFEIPSPDGIPMPLEAFSSLIFDTLQVLVSKTKS